MKWKDFSSSCCHQAVYGKKGTGEAYLAQSEGLQFCIFCPKFHFPFRLEVNGIYQDQFGGVSHILWTQQILDFAFWNQKSQVSFQCSTVRMFWLFFLSVQLLSEEVHASMPYSLNYSPDTNRLVYLQFPKLFSAQFFSWLTGIDSFPPKSHSFMASSWKQKAIYCLTSWLCQVKGGQHLWPVQYGTAR